MDLSPLWISLKTIGIATFISFILGVYGARFVMKCNGKWKGVIDTLFMLLQIFGKRGIMGSFLLEFDEPFSALDYFLKNQMQKQLLGILEYQNKTSPIVTHDIDEAYWLCYRIAVINDGKIDVFDNKKNIFEKPETVSVAKITGCKNISKIKKLDEDRVYAIDWGIELKIPITKKEITHIGIRAHHIR